MGKIKKHVGLQVDIQDGAEIQSAQAAASFGSSSGDSHANHGGQGAFDVVPFGQRDTDAVPFGEDGAGIQQAQTAVPPFGSSRGSSQPTRAAKELLMLCHSASQEILMLCCALQL